MKFLMYLLTGLSVAQAASDGVLFEQREKISTTIVGAIGGAALPAHSKIYENTSADATLQCPAIHAYANGSHRFAVFALPNMPAKDFLPKEGVTHYFISIESRDTALLFRPHSFVDFEAPSLAENPQYKRSYTLAPTLFGLDGTSIPLTDLQPIEIHGDSHDMVMSPANLRLSIPDDHLSSLGIYSVVEGNGRKAVTYHWLIGTSDNFKMDKSVWSSYKFDVFLENVKHDFSGTPEFEEFWKLMMAPRDGLEPPTQWLTATCSTD